MPIFLWILYQLLSYSLWEWLVILVVTAGAAYWGGRPGMILGHCVVACLIYNSDVAYQKSHAAQMEADFMFGTGMLTRILLINTILLPVGFALRRWGQRQYGTDKIEAKATAVMPWK